MKPRLFGICANRFASNKRSLKDLMGFRFEEGEGTRFVATMNVDHVVNLHRMPAFLRAYQNATVVTFDGFPVWMYARCSGFHDAVRLTGLDLLETVISEIDSKAAVLFFIASDSETGKKLLSRLVDLEFSKNRMGFYVPEVGFHTDYAQTEHLISTVKGFGTTHLFMGVGSPKSEMWLNQNSQALGPMWAFGVGAALNFFAGTAKRAPLWLRSIGGEWVWRLTKEPKRLYKRYLFNSWLFLFAIYLDQVSRIAEN